MEFVAMHSNFETNNFACLLLNDESEMTVQAIRRNRDIRDNSDFVEEVLRQWFQQKGNAVPRKWENLIDCMARVGLTPNLVQIIRDKLLGI